MPYLDGDIHTIASLSISNDKSLFYIRTNKNAPRYKIITVDLNDVSREPIDLLPEQSDAFLQSVTCVHDNNFGIIYKRNVG